MLTFIIVMKLQPGRLIKYYYLRFIRLKGDPRAIARGAAIGTFFGITPTIPLHTVSLLIFAPLCRANIVAAFLASMAMCNPLTYFPQYYFSWLIGSKLTPYDLSWSRIHAAMEVIFSNAGFSHSLQAISQLGGETLIVMLVGGVVLAVPFAVAVYFITLRFFIALESKRISRHKLD